MTINDILSMDLSSKNILIIGSPASGKTWLAGKIKERYQADIIHTDEYLKYGANAIEQMLKKIPMFPYAIVEGTLGYRLLLDGHKSGLYKPCIVIHLIVSDSTVQRVYEQERDKSKIRLLPFVLKKDEKELNKYMQMIYPNIPVWYIVTNDRY